MKRLALLLATVLLTGLVCQTSDARGGYGGRGGGHHGGYGRGYGGRGYRGGRGYYGAGYVNPYAGYYTPDYINPYGMYGYPAPRSGFNVRVGL